ncbi:MAG TPA: hypothetical protein VFF30_18725 [Nitrososphaerales archaeon]|nr:hypothetical protein [Nitrososphaerales archaeon]
MITRGKDLFTSPRDDFVIKLGDTLYVLTDHDSLIEFQQKLQSMGMI